MITPKMTVEEKWNNRIFEHGPFFIIEMPPDPSFLYHEGVAMQHCLEFCYREYAERMRIGAQRQFSLIDTRDGQPKVDIELSIQESSYSGPVAYPVVTQIRGIRNQCPPADEYLDAILRFFEVVGPAWVLTDHGVRNFDGQCDGDKVVERWIELSS